MDIKQVYSGETWKAEDLGDDEPTLQINSINLKEFDSGGKKTKKLVIGFAGEEKKLVCNKTNATRIGFMFGNNTDQWIGQSITLIVEHVDFQGAIVPAIRVKVFKPRTINKPANPATHQSHIPPQRVRPSSAEMGQRQNYQQDDDSEIPF